MKRVLAVLLSAVLSLSVAVVPGIQTLAEEPDAAQKTRRAAGGRGGSTGTKCRFVWKRLQVLCCMKKMQIQDARRPVSRRS